MRNGRREVEGISLSFLDVICCGFGAIILLLMITKVVEPIVLENSAVNLDGLVADLQDKLFEIRGETAVLNRDLTVKNEQLSELRDKVARLQGDLSEIKSRFESSRLDSTVSTRVFQELEIAKQRLTDEMTRLLGVNYRRKDDVIGGIPVDSEYIIFIIDTSGSMFENSWGEVQRQLLATLDIYPKVKGIQVMNDMGEYMFSRYRGQWIPDSPARRKAIIERLRGWQPFSNSSPVEGITHAIRTFYAKDKKISLYVFGDEFTGPSVEEVVDTVDRINTRDSQGVPLVRIHALGFPVQFQRRGNLQITGVRFATLMRELAFRNGGTFVGLHSYR
jgi:hypothetical protein